MFFRTTTKRQNKINGKSRFFCVFFLISFHSLSFLQYFSELLLFVIFIHVVLFTSTMHFFIVTTCEYRSNHFLLFVFVKFSVLVLPARMTNSFECTVTCNIFFFYHRFVLFLCLVPYICNEAAAFCQRTRRIESMPLFIALND